MTDLSNISDDQLLSMLSNAAPGAGLSQEIGAIHQNESSGAPDTAAIVNPASGARSSMQVMPKTAANPGYGVTPSNGTPQDDARTGRDYYAALRQKYGAPDLTAIAYDWGPGNTDKWLAAGADPSKLPDETLKYALKFKSALGDTGTAAGPVVPGVTDNPIAAPSPQGTGASFLTKLGAGAGEGFGNTVLGGQALLGKGLDALGANGAGDWLVQDAQQGKQSLAQQATDVAGDSGWRTAGNILGATVPMLAAGPELIPQIAAGGAYGASQGALNNTGILPGAVEGAGLGALGATVGYGAGKAINAGVSAARPLVSNALNAIRGGEQSAAARIGTGLGGDLDSTIGSLNANSNEIIPGSLPTAAEAGNNTDLVAMQRALQNTAQGQIAFTDRMNANNAARWTAANSAVGPNLTQEADAFTQQQAARLAAGQAELPPLSQAQADIMQTPAYRQAMRNAAGLADNRGSRSFVDQQNALSTTLGSDLDDLSSRATGAPTLDAETQAFTNAQAARIKAGQLELPALSSSQAEVMQSPAYRQAMKTARGLADNRGSDVFADQQSPLLQSLRQGIDETAGTPATIDALKAARGQTADQTFGSADVSIPTSWPEYAALSEKPAFQNAMRVAQTMSDNLGEGPLLRTEADGGGDWVAGHGLLYAKGVLDDQINLLLQRDQQAQARPIIAVRNQLVGLMDRASPDYAPARAQFQADSAPIDAQQALQTRLNGTVDPLSGAVSPNKLRQTINSVVGEQLKPGIRPADQVSTGMIEKLRALGQQAQLTPTNLTGLPGEGQEYLRQALLNNVRDGSPDLMRGELNQASQEFDRYLGQKSQNYADYFNHAATTGSDLQSRQALREALNKLSGTAVDPLTGEMNAPRLARAISSMQTAPERFGLAPGSQVGGDLINGLTEIGSRAAAAQENLVGLRGEGQEYLRQALQDRVRASADSLMKRESNSAADAFNRYLGQNSPQYAQYLDQAATTGVDLQSRQALQTALDKLQLGSHNTAGDPIITLNGAKSLLRGDAPLVGDARSYTNNLLADLTRASAANNPLGAAGSQTYANAQLGGGLLGRFIQGRTGDTAIIGTAAAGGVVPAAGAFIVQRAVTRAAAKTEKAAIDLLLNPKRLAKALEEFKGQPKAKQIFIDTLKDKASGAGRAGVRAVQAYEAARTQKRGQ